MKKRTATTPVALIDIGSGSVSVAHALVHNADTKGGYKEPTILTEHTVRIGARSELKLDRFVDDTVAAINTAILAVQKIDLHQPEYILLTFGAPWTTSQTRQVHYQKTGGFKCTQKLIDSLLQKEIDFLLEHEMKESGTDEDVRIIEKQISQISLNGYPTDMPFDKKAEELDVMLTITTTPRTLLRRFIEAVRRHYGMREIGFASRMYSSYIFLRDRYGLTNDAWVIDFADEMTDIGFIKDGFLLYHHTIPIGSNHFARLLTKKGHSAEEAKSLVAAFHMQAVTTRKGVALQKSFTKLLSDWSDSVHEVFTVSETKFALPESCFLIAPKDVAGALSETISRDAFLQQLSSTHAPKVTLLTSQDIATTLGISSKFEEFHPLTVIDTLFVERIL